MATAIDSTQELERAQNAAYTLQHRIIEQVADGLYRCESQAKPGIYYNVDIHAQTCTCPDYDFHQRRREGICKHLHSCLVLEGKIAPLVEWLGSVSMLYCWSAYASNAVASCGQHTWGTVYYPCYPERERLADKQCPRCGREGEYLRDR